MLCPRCTRTYRGRTVHDCGTHRVPSTAEGVRHRPSHIALPAARDVTQLGVAEDARHAVAGRLGAR